MNFLYYALVVYVLNREKINEIQAIINDRIINIPKKC